MTIRLLMALFPQTFDRFGQSLLHWPTQSVYFSTPSIFVSITPQSRYRIRYILQKRRIIRGPMIHQQKVQIKTKHKIQNACSLYTFIKPSWIYRPYLLFGSLINALSKVLFLLIWDQNQGFICYNLMPFSHIHYRWVRSRNYPYQKRRCCYLAVCLTYALAFAIAGFVFLGFYIDIIDQINALNCNSCAYLGANSPCGYQLCCNYEIGIEFSYQFCAQIYGEGLYFILFIVFLAYALYEILLMICMLCNGSALKNNQETIIIDQNQQLINMNGYPQGYQQQGYQQGYQVPQTNQLNATNY